MYQNYVKRILDIFISLIALPFFLISFIFIAPAIYLNDRGTIFYRAERRGIHGTIFEMYKYRSMKMNAPDLRNADNSTFNSWDDPRVTKVGRFLRKTSMDEIPQILNVLKGDMSIIGPRPITINKPLEEYDEKRTIRLQVKPGVTGSVQAYYRNSIGQEEKLQHDAEYAQNVTFLGDVKIMLKTIQTVLQRKNIYIKQENVKDVHEVNLHAPGSGSTAAHESPAGALGIPECMPPNGRRTFIAIKIPHKKGDSKK